MASGTSEQRWAVAGCWRSLALTCAVALLAVVLPRGQSRCRPQSPAQVPVLRDSGNWPEHVPRSRPGETSTGVPVDVVNLSAADRKALFHSVYGGWPPQRRVPSGFGRADLNTDDNDAWHLYNLAKEQDLMQIEDRTWRLDRWLEQVQIRSLVQFSKLGWSVGNMPSQYADLHSRVQSHFRKNHATSPLEKDDRGYTSPQKQAARRLVSLPLKLKSEVTEAVRHFVGEQSGLGYAGIEATATYGIRAYHRGSTLTTHVDKYDTHILSVVYCVDRLENSTDKPWHLELDPDLSGTHVKFDLKAGQLFFYESAKVPHGRTAPLEAEYYAHLFVHFRPVGWLFAEADRRVGLPPFYDATVGAAVPELCLGRDSWLLARKSLEKELQNLRVDFDHILKLRKNAAVAILLVGLAPGFCLGWGCGWFSATRSLGK